MRKSTSHSLELPTTWNHGLGSMGVPRSKELFIRPHPWHSTASYLSAPKSNSKYDSIACVAYLFLINLFTSVRAYLGNSLVKSLYPHFEFSPGLDFKINVVLILRDIRSA